METRKKKILVADDDLAILEVLAFFLEDEGYEVETTHDGRTLQNFERGSADLLLLDIWMSGWNGQDICRFLKSQEATRHLPIMLISANKETEQIAREVGADDFLTKPFDLDELHEKIKRCLQKA